MNKKILIFSLSIIAISLTSYMVFGWSEPITTMPGSYSIPINTSATSQTKAGEIGASSFIDADDPHYYINPSGLTKISGLLFAGSGDFNGDGVLNGRDVRDIAWYVNGFISDLEAPDHWNRPITLDDIARADVNGDGDVDMLDSSLIQKLTVNLFHSLEEARLAGRKIKDIAIDISGDGDVFTNSFSFGGSGDVNKDGLTDIDDAAVIADYLAGSVVFDETQMARADINGDGSVDTLDYQLVRDISLGLYTLDSAKIAGRAIFDRAIDIDELGNVSISNDPTEDNHVATKDYVDNKCVLVAYDNVAPAETCPIGYYVSEGTLSTASGYMMCCHVGNPELIP